MLRLAFSSLRCCLAGQCRGQAQRRTAHPRTPRPPMSSHGHLRTCAREGREVSGECGPARSRAAREALGVDHRDPRRARRTRYTDAAIARRSAGNHHESAAAGACSMTGRGSGAPVGRPGTGGGARPKSFETMSTECESQTRPGGLPGARVAPWHDVDGLRGAMEANEEAATVGEIGDHDFSREHVHGLRPPPAPREAARRVRDLEVGEGQIHHGWKLSSASSLPARPRLHRAVYCGVPARVSDDVAQDEGGGKQPLI